MPAAVAVTASHPPRRCARDVAASVLLVLFRLGTDAVLYSWMAAIWGCLFCGFAVAVWLAPAAVPLILICAYEHFCVVCEEAEKRMGKPTSLVATAVASANEKRPERKGAWAYYPAAIV